VFPGVQKATWTRDPVAKEYYFHRFYDHQPDLNMDHPEVREEVRRIMGFWLQLGVDGFRIDAVPFIIERPDPEGGGPLKELKFEYLEEMRTFQQWRSGDAVLLGEANVLPGQTAPYFRDGHGIHMMFNFWVNQHLFYALASGDVKPLSEALEATREVPPTCQWAHFLRNHDELDLGRLTDEQRALVFQRFGPDKSMQLYDRGIRRRLAPMLGSRAAIELAYSVLLALPGTPILRYGDEVGMGEDLSLDERDAVRTPMQWSTGKNAGFSAAEAKDLVHPVLSDGPYGCKQVCVEKQKRDEESLLRWTIRMLRLRKECPEIGWGSWQILPVDAEGVLVLRYDWRGSALLTVHNFTSAPREVRLALADRPRAGLLNLLVNEELEPEDGELSFVLEAQGFRWFRIGAADAALERGTEAPLTTPEEPPKKKPRKPPAAKKRPKR
jgi:maltose alpha-D-glucosyltransferase/alpha-amylase